MVCCISFFIKIIIIAYVQHRNKEGIRRLYVVKKIKVKRSNKQMGSPSETIEFNYSHESADLEIYTDEALTQHFKTLSLADLTN